MKNKLLAAILCLLTLILLVSSVPVYAESTENTVGEYQNIIDGIVSYKAGNTDKKSIQNWIDGELTLKAGMGGEWFVMALSQLDAFDFSHFETKLLQHTDGLPATSRIKFALTLCATGSTDSYISKTLNDSIGKQGIMSYIFGLHLLNNGYKSDFITSKQIIEELISLQKSDGGWALKGEYSDVDVTAMTVQALAPYYSDEKLKTVIDKAVNLLSEMQLESGGYSSYGNENPESAAQVIVAMSSINIDVNKDLRFLKNGNSIFDSINKFKLESGTFAHTLNGKESISATSQVFYSCVAYKRMIKSKSPLYVFDLRNPENVEEYIENTTCETETESKSESIIESTDSKVNSKPRNNIKIYIGIGIVIAGFAVSVILLILKKKNIKNFVAIIAVVALLLTVLAFLNIQSPKDYYSGETFVKENAIGKVSISLNCENIANKSDKDYIPKDGVILSAVEVDIEEGDTVFDVLTEVARKYKIQIDYSGSENLAYVRGINYIYELDFGDLSGWMYFVNGESPSVGCGEYVLNDGDTVEWHYTCDLGNDIKKK